MFRSGVARMILAAVCFSFMSAAVKALSPRYPAMHLVMWRCLLSLPLLVWWSRKRHAERGAASSSWWRPNSPKLVLLRSVAGMTAMSLSYWALGELPLGDAIMIGKMKPVIVLLLSVWLLGESMSRGGLLIMALSLVGVAVIAKPSLEIGNLGGLAMIGAALASSVAHVTIRRLTADDTPERIVLGFAAVTALATLPLCISDFVVPTPIEWLALVAIAVCATAGQLLMTSAYGVERAPLVSTASYTNVVLVMALGAIFWGEIPTLWTLAGAVLIVGGGIALLWLRRDAGPQAFVPATRS